MAKFITHQMVKPIPEIPGYFVSDNGTIYSRKISPRYNPHGEMRVVKPRLHPSGYLYYGLFLGEGTDKKRLWRRGHRLVAQAFIGNIPNKMDVDHIDGNRHNNNVSNLRIVTHSVNCLEGYKRRNKCA